MGLALFCAAAVATGPLTKLALPSLVALLGAILASLFLRMNAGLIALLLAYGIGLWGGLSLREAAAGFPTQLLLTLVGLTLLFGAARHNGTLDRLAGWAVQLCRGRVGLIPILFFALAAILGTLGAGNIGAVALLAPVAMGAAGQLRIPPFLMAICLGMGGNAAALSPLSPTGVVAASLLARAGLPGVAWISYRDCLVAHAVIGLGGYLLLGGYRLLKDDPGPEERDRLAALLLARREPLRGPHLLTLLVILALLVAVALFRADVGALALCGAMLLVLLGVADEQAALREVPFGTVLMVCGLMTLVALLEKSGGTAMLASLLGRAAGPRGILALVGLLTGTLSAYSSSAGVVLPTFLPLVPGLAQHTGADLLSLASSINVGAHLVDVSPLSTLGALCLASAAKDADRGALYRQLLAWGMAMALVGALYCYVVFGLLRLA